MGCCGDGAASTDFMYPLVADIYYPVVEQTAYGNVKKQWILDKSVPCYFSAGGGAGREELKTNNVSIVKESLLIGRVKSDVRISASGVANAMTNVIITNIRDAQGTEIYVETAGVRVGKSSIFEVATQEPALGPFGTLEYYKLVVRRSENQAADV